MRRLGVCFFKYNKSGSLKKTLEGENVGEKKIFFVSMLVAGCEVVSSFERMHDGMVCLQMAVF